LTTFKIRIYTLEQYLASADNLPQIEDVENQLFHALLKMIQGIQRQQLQVLFLHNHLLMN
jgi:hypothetical protein